MFASSISTPARALFYNVNAAGRRLCTHTHTHAYSYSYNYASNSLVHRIPISRTRTRLTPRRAFSGAGASLSATSERDASSFTVAAGDDRNTNTHTHTHTRISESESHLPFSSMPASPLERLKHPVRGGRDLARRYVRLERAVRGKEGYEREIEGYGYEYEYEGASLGGMGTEMEGKEENQNQNQGREGTAPLVFAGFAIPETPKPPEPDECCMSGCAVCVHDLYAETLDAHERALVALRGALKARGVAEETWPVQIRPAAEAGRRDGGVGKAREATLSAFEQMELQLAARRMQTQSLGGGGEGGEGHDRMDRTRSAVWGTKETAALDFNPNRNPESRTRVKAKKSLGTDMHMAVVEALSWILFSRR